MNDDVFPAWIRRKGSVLRTGTVVYAYLLLIPAYLASSVITVQRFDIHPVVSGDVVVLAFNLSSIKDLPGVHVELTHRSLSYTYEARIIVVVTHTAPLDDGSLLVALGEPPGPMDRYGVIVGDETYAAVRLEDLAARIRADEVVIIGCNVTREAVEKAFSGREVTVYYYACPADPGDAVSAAAGIIRGEGLDDPCLRSISFRG